MTWGGGARLGKCCFFSGAYTALVALTLNALSPRVGSLTYVFNLAGGAFLTGFFYPKYMPEQFQHKKIWKALLISLLIIIPFVIALLYSLGE